METYLARFSYDKIRYEEYYTSTERADQDVYLTAGNEEELKARVLYQFNQLNAGHKYASRGSAKLERLLQVTEVNPNGLTAAIQESASKQKESDRVDAINRAIAEKERQLKEELARAETDRAKAFAALNEAAKKEQELRRSLSQHIPR